jgi:organic hydroperoxide reductase OsmC/OhrA
MISHTFAIDLRWTGNRGTGTADYRAYARDYEISGDGNSRTIVAFSDPNTEELLIGSLSAGHMLRVLQLCADAGITSRTTSTPRAA